MRRVKTTINEQSAGRYNSSRYSYKGLSNWQAPACLIRTHHDLPELTTLLCYKGIRYVI